MKNTRMQKVLHWVLIALIMVLLLGCCIPMSPSLAPEEPLIQTEPKESEQASMPSAKDDAESAKVEPAPPENEPDWSEEPSTETVTTLCSKCIGSGRCVDCIDGECFLCGGTGEQECFGCLDGECMDCSGDGYTYETNFYTGDSEKTKCGSCNGSGNCRTCSGSGKEDCDECGGSKNCGSCGGEVECAYCDGTGIGGKAVMQNTESPQQSTTEETDENSLYIAHGTSGSMVWELGTDNTLTIYGDMPDYNLKNPAPWLEYADSIDRVRINDARTIGSAAFYNCYYITSVVITGDSLKKIGDSAFFDCVSLNEIELPNGLVEIGGSAFSGCTELDSLTIPASVKTMGIGVFYDWTSSQTLYFEGTALKPQVTETRSGVTYKSHPLWMADCNANIIWP